MVSDIRPWEVSDRCAFYCYDVVGLYSRSCRQVYQIVMTDQEITVHTS